MKLLASKARIQGMAILLADKAHEQDPQCKWLLYVSHNHPYINSSDMAVTTLFTATYVGMVV